jgi:oligoendopeptidase F
LPSPARSAEPPPLRGRSAVGAIDNLESNMQFKRRLWASVLAVALSIWATSPAFALTLEDFEPTESWDFSHIYPDFEAWEADFDALEQLIERGAAMKGTLSEGPERLLEYYRLQDQAGKMAYKVYRYVNLQRDLDLRNNDMNAYRQRVQSLFAKWTTATSWFQPELLSIPFDTMKGWLDGNLDLSLYRFAIEENYRLQEHVLDEGGERLLSLSSTFDQSPADIYAMLTTADVQWPTITLSTGEELQVTTGQYYARLQTEPAQADREAVWRAFFGVYEQSLNTYASIYNALCQRDWARAQARNYESTLDARLFENNIPTTVVETLIDVTKRGAGPLQRYFEIKRNALGLEKIDLYDMYVQILEDETKYPYAQAARWVVEAVAPLGGEYQEKLAHGLQDGWVDVHETQGKRSGAYSAGLYGVHPYVLLNYQERMNDVFTLAHEMGHAMHSVLASESQPFVYSDYTIFVAEVASTLNEGLLLDYLLDRTEDPRQRIALLQHAIDGISQTFYRQVCFADFELAAHRMVESGEPITADVLRELYHDLLREYYGPNVELDPLFGIVWARIPHFYRTPYYVYQYATCYASSAKILNDVREGDDQQRQEALGRYLNLLRSGGSDHPMEQLKAAGVDLSDPATVQAVVDMMDALVSRLDQELRAL